MKNYITKIEPEINEEFILDGDYTKVLKCVADDGNVWKCQDCYYYSHIICQNTLNCSNLDRKDKTSVHFIKVK